MAARKEQRKPPMHRQIVTVGSGKGRRQYEVVTNLYDPNYPVFVGSASQSGFWIVWRDERQKCSHIEAAVQADTVLFAPDPWPGAGESQDYERWLDSLNADPPDDDGGPWSEDLPPVLAQR